MRKAIALTIIVACAVGCTTKQDTTFEQFRPDGSREMFYENGISVPLWGKADAVSGEMGASIDSVGAWKLDVGQTAKGLDNTGQIKALQEMMDGLVRTLQTGVQGVQAYYGGRAAMATAEGNQEDDEFLRLANCPVIDSDGDGVPNGPDADWLNPDIQ